jgi:hypothetical protein
VQHTSVLVKEVTLNDLQFPEQALQNTMLQTKTRSFLENAEFFQVTAYIQLGQLRHNCPNTNLVGWHNVLFQHVQNIQLGAM